MKKILCCLPIVIALLLCSCDSFDNTMNHDYDTLSKHAEYVEIVYNNGSEEVIIERLDYQKSIDFIKEFSRIEYQRDSALSILFCSPVALSAGLNFRIKQSDLAGDYQYFSVLCGGYICDSDEYYDLIEKYCPEDDIEYYRQIEPYKNTD